MRHQAFAIVIAFLALGCTSPTETDLAPEARTLVGRWESARENINVVGTGGIVVQTGSYQTTLVFQSNGSAVVDVRNYGLYPAQKAGDLSAYNTSTGTFQVVGDSLTILGTRSVWWDRFYGANSPEHVETLPAERTFYHRAKFTIVGDRLILDYLSYPADAPVPTTATFFRAD